MEPARLILNMFSSIVNQSDVPGRKKFRDCLKFKKTFENCKSMKDVINLANS